MKDTKRILAVLLALLMLVSSIPYAVAEEEATSGKCGESVFWRFDKSSKTMTISGSGPMSNYINDESPFCYKSDIESVLIGEGVTSVGDWMFEGCDGLKRVTLPDSVTILGDYSFLECSSLVDIIITNKVKSIGDGAFAECSSFTSVLIPNSVTKIGNAAFSNCSKLTNVTIPNSVTSIGSGPFSSCDKLSSIIVNGDNLFYSTDENGCLYNKDKSDLIQYPTGNSRREFIVPDSVTSIGPFAFDGCNCLTSVIMPNGLKSIGGWAFSNCSNLVSARIPNSVAELFDGAFEGCSSLKSVTLPNNMTYTGQNVFKDCNSLISVTIPFGVTKISRGMFWQCKELSSVTISKSVKSIDYGAFYRCDALSDIYYTGTRMEWDCIIVESDYNDSLEFATLHFNSINAYNLGEESYSFGNYVDKDSKIGHCFGMAATSSMYHLGLLNKSVFGGNNLYPLYSFEDTDNIRDPICHYQNIQGKTAINSTVAGGFHRKHNSFIDYFLYTAHIKDIYNIEKDWKEVIDYVKNHQFDGAGNLQIDIWKEGKGGHTVNFLRFDDSFDEDRIYVYDNNYPTVETYFYKDISGNVCQAPFSTFKGSIDSIGIIDTVKYFNFAKSFKSTRAIYASSNMINIDGADVSPMSGDGSEVRYMLELPEDLNKAEIIPLVDNAEFTYLDQTYQFGIIDEDTIGILTLSENENSVGSLKIENAPADISNVCKWCGKTHEGFFQGIIGFFHKILAAILGAKY